MRSYFYWEVNFDMVYEIACIMKIMSPTDFTGINSCNRDCGLYSFKIDKFETCLRYVVEKLKYLYP